MRPSLLHPLKRDHACGTGRSTAKLAKSFGLEKNELRIKLLQKGLLRKYEDEVVLTRAGRAAGGESRFSNKHGVYFLWPNNFTI